MNTTWLPKMFLTIAGTFGIIFAVLTPPFQVSDEFNHFFRAYQISEGHLVSKKISKENISADNSNLFPGYEPNATNYLVGDVLPTDLVRVSTKVSGDIIGKQSHKQDTGVLKGLLTLPRDTKDAGFVNFPNSSLYSPVPYIPQSVAILLLRLFNAPVLVLMYGGRFLNLAVFCCLTYLAVKYAPKFKLLIAFIALMPVSLQLAASNSPDALLIASTLFLLSWVLFLHEKDGLTSKDLTVLALAAIVTALQKSAYFPLLLILILIPVKHKKYWLQMVCIFALALISTGTWAYFSKDLYIPLRENVNIAKQIAFIKENPINYLLIMKNTLVGHRNYFIQQFVGGLGWLDVPFSTSIAYIYVIFLIITSLFEEKSSLVKRGVLIISGISTILLAVTMIYLSWVPAGHSVIDGLVGRYFIPTAPYILGGIAGVFRIPKIQGKLEKALLFVPVTVLIYAIYLICIRYYA